MARKAPSFWWQKPGWRAWALWPVSMAYGLVAGARMAAAKREQVGAAVLCVGNFSVGGEGKTPVAIALAKQAKRQKLRAGFLTRGYGGRLKEPHLVDAGADTVSFVGDEPLLLARHAPTVVTPDRLAGARRLIEEGCDLLIMDDGFQSAHIHMDYALLVVDASRGLGNGHVFPAGPLRAPLGKQMPHADGVVVMGEGEAADIVVRRAARAGKPVFTARLRPRRGHNLKNARVLAFAGIGNPEKFYSTLRAAGAEVVATCSFPDHHPFSPSEIEELVFQAEAERLQLVTTEKDLVRLENGPQGVRNLAATIKTLPVEAVFDVAGTPEAILRNTMEAWRNRTLNGLAVKAAAS